MTVDEDLAVRQIQAIATSSSREFLAALSIQAIGGDSSGQADRNGQIILNAEVDPVTPKHRKTSLAPSIPMMTVHRLIGLVMWLR